MRKICWLRGIFFISVQTFVAALALFRRGATHNPNVPRSLQWFLKTNKTESGTNVVASLFRKAMRLRRDESVHDAYALSRLTGYTELTDNFGRVALEKKGPGGSNEDTMQFIRLEKEPDSSALMDIVTREDVVDKIREVREEQSRFGCADLYPREWHRQSPRDNGKVTVNGNNAMGVSDRQSNGTDERTSNGSSDNSVATFSAMQFNALAEGLSSGPNNCRPFNTVDLDETMSPKEDSRNRYGGFSSLPHPSIVLDFGRRKWRLLEVLVGSNGDAPFDLLALEEIDRYRGFFEPMLSMFGYDGIFVPKPKSPGVRMGWYSDGCALAWKRNVFELVFERRDAYTVGNQVFIIAALRHRATGQTIVVAVTHLKAQRSEANEWTRCRQVEELLAAVDESTTCVLGAEGNQANVPILLLGDFNADPPSAQRGFKESAVEHLLLHNIRAVRPSLPLVRSTSQLSGNGTMRRYQSAYPLVATEEELYTSWKIRGSTTTKRVIDYIFFFDGYRAGTTSQLQCVATLQVPRSDSLELTKLPGLRYPSDHMHLGAQFLIRSSDEV